MEEKCQIFKQIMVEYLHDNLKNGIIEILEIQVILDSCAIRLTIELEQNKFTALSR